MKRVEQITDLEKENLKEIRKHHSKYRELMCYPKFRQVPLNITQPFDILAS